MYEVLGFLNIFLLSVLVLPYVLRMANAKFVHTKASQFFALLKALRAVHKPAAALLVVSMGAHAYLALGRLQLHTGTVAVAGFVLTALLGLAYYASKKKPLLILHRSCMALSVVLLVTHLVRPWLFS